MQRNEADTSRDKEILNARDILQLLLIEFGDVHIETLGQLLQLTCVAEKEYSRICIQRHSH